MEKESRKISFLKDKKGKGRKKGNEMIQKNYCFADVVVQARYRDSYMEELCKKYETDLPEQFVIEVTEEGVRKEEKNSSDKELPFGYLESLAFYRQFCEKAVEKNILLFHSSVVAVDGEAYIFTAPSGTGKSTHTALWRKVFGHRAVMINDDKPLLKIEQDAVWVYGTPWDGKHRISTNTKARVRAVCILQRGEENEIHRENFYEAYPFILKQTYLPNEEMGMKKTLELVNQFMGRVPVYTMKCTISEEAARMAYQTMKLQN